MEDGVLTTIGYGINTDSFADVAKDIIEKGREEKKGAPEFFKGLTTTKLRSIYSTIMNVRLRLTDPNEFSAVRSDIQYLKVRMAYEAGRERSVKTFLEQSHLLDALNNVNDFDSFALYCRYAESLVAYFKFFGGKDS